MNPPVNPSQVTQAIAFLHRYLRPQQLAEISGSDIIEATQNSVLVQLRNPRPRQQPVYKFLSHAYAAFRSVHTWSAAGPAWPPPPQFPLLTIRPGHADLAAPDWWWSELFYLTLPPPDGVSLNDAKLLEIGPFVEFMMKQTVPKKAGHWIRSYLLGLDDGIKHYNFFLANLNRERAVPPPVPPALTLADADAFRVWLVEREGATKNMAYMYHYCIRSLLSAARDHSWEGIASAFLEKKPRPRGVWDALTAFMATKGVQIPQVGEFYRIGAYHEKKPSTATPADTERVLQRFRVWLVESGAAPTSVTSAVAVVERAVRIVSDISDITDLTDYYLSLPASSRSAFSTWWKKFYTFGATEAIQPRPSDPAAWRHVGRQTMLVNPALYPNIAKLSRLLGTTMLSNLYWNDVVWTNGNAMLTSQSRVPDHSGAHHFRLVKSSEAIRDLYLQMIALGQYTLPHLPLVPARLGSRIPISPGLLRKIENEVLYVQLSQPPPPPAPSPPPHVPTPPWESKSPHFLWPVNPGDAAYAPPPYSQAPPPVLLTSTPMAYPTQEAPTASPYPTPTIPAPFLPAAYPPPAPAPMPHSVSAPIPASVSNPAADPRSSLAPLPPADPQAPWLPAGWVPPPGMVPTAPLPLEGPLPIIFDPTFLPDSDPYDEMDVINPPILPTQAFWNEWERTREEREATFLPPEVHAENCRRRRLTAEAEAALAKSKADIAAAIAAGLPPPAPYVIPLYVPLYTAPLGAKPIDFTPKPDTASPPPLPAGRVWPAEPTSPLSPEFWDDDAAPPFKFPEVVLAPPAGSPIPAPAPVPVPYPPTAQPSYPAEEDEPEWKKRLIPLPRHVIEAVRSLAGRLRLDHFQETWEQIEDNWEYFTEEQRKAILIIREWAKPPHPRTPMLPFEPGGDEAMGVDVVDAIWKGVR